MRNFIWLLVLLPITFHGQLKPKDSTKVKADLSVTGFWQGGNVETLIFRTTGNVSFNVLDDVKFRTQNSYVYQAFGGDKADEDILSLNFINFFPDKRIHPLVLGFFSTNFRREIDYRYLAGGGFSYSILKKTKQQLNMSLTAEYEHTEFDTTDFNENEYDGLSEINTWRSTLWMKGRYKLFKEKMIVTHEMFFQPSLEASKNFRWRLDLGLEFPVWKWMNFKINYLRTYESIVVAGQLQEDEFLTFGLTLKNYK